jgi:hypothetical protein
MSRIVSKDTPTARHVSGRDTFPLETCHAPHPHPYFCIETYIQPHPSFPSFILKIVTSLYVQIGHLQHMIHVYPESWNYTLDTGRENLLRHLALFTNCTTGFVEPKYVPIFHMHLIQVIVFFQAEIVASNPFPILFISSFTPTHLK